MKRLMGTAAVMVLASGVALAQGNLLVLSKKAHTLAIVDGMSLKVLARVPVGEDPHEVIASSDGKTAYVSNYGFGRFHTLTVIDLVGAKALPVVDLGALAGPHGLTFVGGKTWFTAEAAKAIGRYDPATGKVDWILGTGQNRTHMIWVSADGQEIVTTNVNSGTVSLIDREALRTPGPPPGGMGGPPPPPLNSGDGKDWNETAVEVGSGAEGFDVSPDGRELWVANAQEGTVSVIDRASKQVVATIQAQAEGANRLKFTADGRRALVAGRGGVTVLDVASRTVMKRMAVGAAAGIQMAPDGRRAFVACGQDNYVAVVDLGKLEVVGKIDAGGEPDGMAWMSKQ
jgi:YVTN family beta-propeller protein